MPAKKKFSAQIAVPIREEQKSVLQEMAEKESATVAYIVRRIIESAVESYKQGESNANSDN